LRIEAAPAEQERIARAIAAVAAPYGPVFEAELARITAAPREVHDRYALRIPVLAAGTDELDAAGLADAVIMRWLRAHARDGRGR